MEPIGLKFSRPVMGTRFVLLLCGTQGATLRAAAEEALDEAERLEQQMSLFIRSGELAGINEQAHREPVRTEPGLFELLARAARLARQTGGAFDPTTAPLLEAWGFHGATRRPGRAADAWQCVGMQNVLLDAEERTVRFAKPGMALDLGGIAKGYALESIAHSLQEAGIAAALIHAGTSTVYAMGIPPNEPDGWTVGIADPSEIDRRLAVVRLRDQALSVSNASDKFMEYDGVRYGHILDPHTGRPAQGMRTVAVVCDSPTESDALATAFFVMGATATRAYCDTHSHVGALLAPDTGEMICTERMQEVLAHDG